MAVLLIAAGLVLSLAREAQAAPAYIGSQLHSLWHENYGDMDRELDSLKDLGANVVRIDINWSQLEETGPGQYTGWYRDRIDNFMAGAARRGIKVLASINNTPCWASSAPTHLKYGCAAGWQARGVTTYPPTKASTYGDICRYVASRYKSSLVGIEVWNEPNLAGFFTASDPAKSYVPLVKAAYPAIKAVAPGVKVLAGAMSMADAAFLKKLYAYGMKGYYDALSVHPYVGDGSAGPDTDWGPQYASWTFLPGLKLIRSTQGAAGDSKPVWATEFGWQTSAVRNSQYGYLNGVSEATQADYLARAIRLLKDPAAGLGFVEGAITYNFRDNSTDTADFSAFFGLLRRDFSKKPSFDAVRQAIAG